MTSISNNYVWTPELIEQDKALKEKYGAGAHITPARESDYRQKGLPVPTLKNLATDVVELNNKKAEAKEKNANNKTPLNLFGFSFPFVNPPIMDPFNPASPLYNPFMDPGNVASPMNPCNIASPMNPCNIPGMM